MKEKELKNLTRADLLEMLLAQSKENEQIKVQLEETQNKLASRRIALKQVGNIAEASLQLNGVFTAAQEACDQYIENVKLIVIQHKKQCNQMMAETREKCEQMLQDTRQQCESMEAEANQQYSSIIEEANHQYNEIVNEATELADNIIIEANNRCDAIWKELYDKIRDASGYDFDMQYLLSERFGVGMEE